MNESSSNSTSSESTSFELISNSNSFLNNNENVPISSNSTNSNKWNEHYTAAYYGTADSYYRNLHYSHQSTHNQFNPQAYWLHAAASSVSEQSLNSWQASLSNHHLNTSNNPSLSINSHNPYYPIPQLNTTNLTAPSSSSSSSSSTSSSAANTPQSNNLNITNNHSDTAAALNNKLSLINTDSGHFVSTSAASNTSMHSQLVNAAYQSYTNNFVLPHSHAHYPNQQQQNPVYPPTPPKDSNSNHIASFINKTKQNHENNAGSLLTISQTVSDSVKSENFLTNPTCGSIEASSDYINNLNSIKKNKPESVVKRKNDIEILCVEVEENLDENFPSDEEYEEIEENDQVEDEEVINDEDSLDNIENTSSSNKNNFVSNNNQEWICNKRCNSANNFNGNGEKEPDQEKWTQNSSVKISNNNLSNKKKMLPGKNKTKLFIRSKNR